MEFFTSNLLHFIKRKIISILGEIDSSPLRYASKKCQVPFHEAIRTKLLTHDHHTNAQSTDNRLRNIWLYDTSWHAGHMLFRHDRYLIDSCLPSRRSMLKGDSRCHVSNNSPGGLSKHTVHREKLHSSPPPCTSPPVNHIKPSKSRDRALPDDISIKDTWVLDKFLFRPVYISRRNSANVILCRILMNGLTRTPKPEARPGNEKTI